MSMDDVSGGAALDPVCGTPAQKTGYSFLKIMTGSDLSRRRIPMMTIKSGRPGPVVWLTACIHGDEVGGMVVIQELFRYIRRNPLRCGSLYALPLMNPIGFEMAARHVTMSKEDLNRSFPGNRQGTLAQRIADRIMTAIGETGPDLVIDLHNDWMRSIPYAVIEPPPGGDCRTGSTAGRWRRPWASPACAPAGSAGTAAPC